RQQPLAADFTPDRRIAGRLPLDPDRLDTEIVERPDLEIQRFAVEHDLLPWQSFGGKARRFVVAGANGDGKGSLSGQSVLVLPGQDELARVFDRLRRARKLLAAKLSRLAIDGAADQRAIGRGLKGCHASFD